MQCLADWAGYGRPQERPVETEELRLVADLRATLAGYRDRAAVLRQVKRPCAGGVVGGPF